MPRATKDQPRGMTCSKSVAILPNRRFGLYKSVVGSFASDCGWRAWRVGGLNSRGLFNADENPLRGDRADQCQTDPILFRNQCKHDTRSLSFSCPITIPWRFLQGFSRATRVL